MKNLRMILAGVFLTLVVLWLFGWWVLNDLADFFISVMPGGVRPIYGYEFKITRGSILRYQIFLKSPVSIDAGDFYISAKQGIFSLFFCPIHYIG